MRKRIQRPESEEFKKIKAKVKRRDKRTCQLCGYKQKIQIHHIQRYSDSILLREDEKNLICLCKFCHKSVTGREKQLAPLLNEIVMSKYKK